MAGNQQASAQQMIAQNAQLRAALLATSPRMRKNLGSFTGGTLGGTTRVKLYNVGIITRLILKVSVQVDIAVAIATPSPQAPFNLINRLRLTDFDGTDRVNLSGFQLFQMLANRAKDYYGFNNQLAPFAGAVGAGTNLPVAVMANPVVPTAIAGAKTLQFFIEVPLAYDPASDLRGAILAQTALGEMYLNLDWNALLYGNANADAVYNGAGTSTVGVTAGQTINVQVWQEYLLPQSIGGTVPLPQLDLLTVYELAGAIKSSDNLGANVEKLVNMPNVRSVVGTYIHFVNNGVMNSATALDATGTANANADVSQLRVIANGNNILYDNSADGHLFEMRLRMQSDMRNGVYVFNFRDKPIETALYGNVQIGFTPSAVNAGNTYLGIAFESFYTKGATLPGLSQASG